MALFNILPGSVLDADPLSPKTKLNLAGIGIGSRGGAVADEAAGGEILVASRQRFHGAAQGTELTTPYGGQRHRRLRSAVPSPRGAARR